MGYCVTDHAYYCGIDLHTRTMFVSICDASGNTVYHRNLPTTSEALTRALKPFRADVVVTCGCMFTWYWMADWRQAQAEQVPFVLGHALG